MLIFSLGGNGSCGSVGAVSTHCGPKKGFNAKVLLENWRHTLTCTEPFLLPHIHTASVSAVSIMQVVSSTKYRCVCISFLGSLSHLS